MCRIPELVEVSLDPEKCLGTLEPWYLSESDLYLRRNWAGLPAFCWNQYIWKLSTSKPLLRVQVNLADVLRDAERKGCWVSMGWERELVKTQTCLGSGAGIHLTTWGTWCREKRYKVRSWSWTSGDCPYLCSERGGVQAMVVPALLRTQSWSEVTLGLLLSSLAWK